MELMSGFYRQNEDSLSLLLQQYVCDGVPVCLGCVCGGEMSDAGIKGGLITGWLLRQFRGLNLCEVIEKPQKFIGRFERELNTCWDRHSVLQNFWTVGILCIGYEFLIFYEGAVQLWLCNTYLGRPDLQRIGVDDRTETHELRFHRGIMESDIGILLASESFCRQLSTKELSSCLAVKAIKDSTQTQKRIRELGSLAEKKGGRNMAALLLEIR